MKQGKLEQRTIHNLDKEVGILLRQKAYM